MSEGQKDRQECISTGKMLAYGNVCENRHVREIHRR